MWIWTAMDADSKLCVSWLAGVRDSDWALDFMDDVGSDIDYAVLVKLYGRNPKEDEMRYSLAVCTWSART